LGSLKLNIKCTKILNQGTLNRGSTIYITLHYISFILHISSSIHDRLTWQRLKHEIDHVNIMKIFSAIVSVRSSRTSSESIFVRITTQWRNFPFSFWTKNYIIFCFCWSLDSSNKTSGLQTHRKNFHRSHYCAVYSRIETHLLLMT
jgi:hypothetical protein